MKNEPKNEIDLERTEAAIAEALFAAASYRPTNATATVNIKRGEKVWFTFKIGGLDEDQWQKCRRQNLSNRGKLTEELKLGRFYNQVIYEATVDEDRELIWKNKTVWKKFNVLSGVDLVGAFLTLSEKTKIFETITKLSGYEDDLEDLISE